MCLNENAGYLCSWGEQISGKKCKKKIADKFKRFGHLWGKKDSSWFQLQYTDQIQAVALY